MPNLYIDNLGQLVFNNNFQLILNENVSQEEPYIDPNSGFLFFNSSGEIIFDIASLILNPVILPPQPTEDYTVELTSTSKDGKFCDGTSVTFTANVTPSGTGYLYVWYINDEIIEQGTDLSSIVLNTFQDDTYITCVVYVTEILYTISNSIKIWSPGKFEISIIRNEQNYYECSYKDVNAIYEWIYYKGDYPSYGKIPSRIIRAYGIWSYRHMLYSGELYKGEPNYPGDWSDCVLLNVYDQSNQYCNKKATATYCEKKH